MGSCGAVRRSGVPFPGSFPKCPLPVHPLYVLRQHHATGGTGEVIPQNFGLSQRAALLGILGDVDLLVIRPRAQAAQHKVHREL